MGAITSFFPIFHIFQQGCDKENGEEDVEFDPDELECVDEDVGDERREKECVKEEHKHPGRQTHDEKKHRHLDSKVNAFF